MVVYKIYVKQLPTGELYLGRTIFDPFNYMGSGTVWKRYIKKFNYTNKDIKTWIIHRTTSLENLKEIGLIYSKLLNIVESSNWLNLIEESGEGLTNPSKEVREKMRNAKLGKKRTFTEEHKKNMSIVRKGIPLKDYHKKAIEENNKSPEQRLKRSIIFTGRRLSEETKRRVGEASKGRKANLGKKMSDESKQKMINSLKQTWLKKKNQINNV